MKQFFVNLILSINHLDNKVQYLSGKSACHSLSKSSIQSAPGTLPLKQSLAPSSLKHIKAAWSCGYTLAAAQPHLWFGVQTGIRLRPQIHPEPSKLSVTTIKDLVLDLTADILNSY